MGGGGGGGRSGSLGDIRALEQKAKELLKKGESSSTNLFISFAYEDVNDVNLLRGQAKNENSDLEFSDWSVQEPYESERADYIRQKLRERINRCSTTLVYLSPSAAKSKWVAWEVEKSLELGKRVIAVHSGKIAPTPLPQVVATNRIKIVPWSALADELRNGK
jgi:hypothetical protein